VAPVASSNGVQTERLCLADGSIFAFAQGQLGPDAVAQVEEHLSICGDCRAAVAATAQFLCSGGAAPASAPPEQKNEWVEGQEGPLSVGMTVSRYIIAEIIGTGAAGIVYRAYDSELRRNVALKLLRTGDAPRRRLLKPRLLREARAMAQLSHPNVVTVFDVGTYGEEIFVVLELVQGQTLAEWLALRERSWDEIRNAFREAGKGLAAAHAVQLVHRDFKPANVLVGADGRVRVTDFGLAQPMDVDAEPSSPEGAPRDAGHIPLFTMTATGGGGLAGTPVYMAPEQFAGRRADGRSDQFSFCVALYMALYRRHPYFDLNMAARPHALRELERTIVRGELTAPAARADVPVSVLAKLRRGLAVDPTARFPSMEALLDEVLGPDVPVRPVTAPVERRRRVTAGAALATAIAMASLGLMVHGRLSRTAPPASGETTSATVATTASSGAAPLAAGSAGEAGEPVRPATSETPAASDAVGAAAGADEPRPEARRRRAVRRHVGAAPRSVQYLDGLKDPFQ